MCSAGFREEGEAKVTESYEYDLIGVTVHTGTADGGHYYSFIRDIVNPHAYKNNKWWEKAARYSGNNNLGICEVGLLTHVRVAYVAGTCSTTQRWSPSTRPSWPPSASEERWRYELRAEEKQPPPR